MNNIKPDKSIEDTGERMIPAYHKSHMVYGEHIVRYSAIHEVVKNKIVLDIASGSGYGTSLLAETAKKVYGVDVDEKAIKYANKNYSAENTSFIHGNGATIPLDDSSVDVIVSFETIEHILDYQTFLKEIKRVLRTNGLFILSTPNDIEFPESNHFHVHEFEEKELTSLVKKYFKYQKSYYQASWNYNGLFNKHLIMKEWDASIRVLQTAPIGLEKCTYFYFLLSNRDISEEIEPLSAISEHWSERLKEEYEDSVRTHIEEQGKIIKHLENTIRDKDIELEHYIHFVNKLKKSPFGRLYYSFYRKS